MALPGDPEAVRLKGRKGFDVMSFANNHCLHAGYRAMTLGATDELRLPANYHKPTDTPDRLDWDCVADGARVTEALIRRMG